MQTQNERKVLKFYIHEGILSVHSYSVFQEYDDGRVMTFGKGSYSEIVQPIRVNEIKGYFEDNKGARQIYVYEDELECDLKSYLVNLITANLMVVWLGELRSKQAILDKEIAELQERRGVLALAIYVSRLKGVNDTTGKYAEYIEDLKL